VIGGGSPADAGADAGSGSDASADTRGGTDGAADGGTDAGGGSQVSIVGATFAAIRGVPTMPVVARLTDSDPTSDASAFTAMIDWGDGNVIAGVVTGGAGALEVSGLHTYTGPVRTFATTVTVSKRGTTAPLSVTGMATVDPASTAWR